MPIQIIPAIARIGTTLRAGAIRKGAAKAGKAVLSTKLLGGLGKGRNVTLDISSNAKQVEKRLKQAGKDIDKSMKRALSITAQEGINIIEGRTEDGVGYKGGAFKGYSEKYAKFRSAKGRGKNVDLQFTGRMLGSMTSKADKRKAKIFFTRAEEAKKAAMNNKTRPFFGFNKQEEKQLANIFFRNIK